MGNVATNIIAIALLTIPGMSPKFMFIYHLHVFQLPSIVQYVDKQGCNGPGNNENGESIAFVYIVIFITSVFNKAIWHSNGPVIGPHNYCWLGL